jgi:hypothetical protein
MNVVGQILKEFCPFGAILAIQENQQKHYALIEFADLYDAFKVVNSKRRFFSNEFARPFFAVDVDEAELAAVRAEYRARKDLLKPKPDPNPPEVDDWGLDVQVEETADAEGELNPNRLLTDMLEAQERKIVELENCQDPGQRMALQEQIDNLSHMLDMVAETLLAPVTA